VKAKYPAVVLVPGYGGAMVPIDRTWDGYITLSVNPRSHGASSEYWKAPVTHLAYRIDEPERYYYRQAMLDCLRGAQFLFDRPEVDPKRVGSEGGSQGGLFAISTAALEPRISCVVSNITSWCAFADRQYLAYTGTQRTVNSLLEKADGTTSEPLLHRSLVMTDAANLATLIKCPVQINMGGIDMICPWPTGIVLYNRLPKGVIKEYNISPEAAHSNSPKMKNDARRWQRRFLKP
jgi:cephalosporin-C deacetylase-like acetyl esterase